MRERRPLLTPARAREAASPDASACAATHCLPQLLGLRLRVWQGGVARRLQGAFHGASPVPGAAQRPWRHHRQAHHLERCPPLAQAILEAGLGWIDTAEVYGFGKSEEFLGESPPPPSPRWRVPLSLQALTAVWQQRALRLPASAPPHDCATTPVPRRRVHQGGGCRRADCAGRHQVSPCQAHQPQRPPAPPASQPPPQHLPPRHDAERVVHAQTLAPTPPLCCRQVCAAAVAPDGRLGALGAQGQPGTPAARQGRALHAALVSRGTARAVLCRRRRRLR